MRPATPQAPSSRRAILAALGAGALASAAFAALAGTEVLAWREAIAGAGITAVTLALNWWAGTDAPARRTRGTDTDGVEHLRAVHDTLVDGIVTMNAGGTICSVNPAMTRIFGYAAEEMVGQPVALLMPPEVAQQHGDYVRRQQKDAPSRVIGTGREETARRKDGDVFPISLAVSRMTIGGEPMFTGVIRDISQRRMAERAVQETNRLLALAEELAHVGHWYLRPDTGTLTWSEECYRIHGLLPGAEIPVLDTIIMLLHPDDRVAVALSIRRALDTGQGFEMEARLELPAGGLRTLRLKVVAEAPEGDGRSRGLVGIVQDITQRRAAEAALNASLERFHDYARAASDWFWEMDGEQRFTYVSDRFQSATGLDSGFLVGRFYREVAEADPASLVWQAHLDDLAHTRPIKDFVFTVRRPDGPRRHFRVSGMPFHDAEGSFAGYRGVGADITVAVATEKALQESEARFRDLIEGSIQGVFVHRGFHILFANEAYARMMGYVSIEEALAQPSMLDTIAPESRSKAERRYQRLMAGEVMPGLQRERNIRRDGSEMWVDLVDRVVTWNGEPAVQVTLMDITDRVQSERELEVQAAKVMALAEEIDAAREEAERNRRKAEAANAAKSRFLAVMSHELRTPMTGIMGVVDLLLGYAPRGEQRTLLRTLKDSAETLLTLLNDVLDFSKIEAGQLRLECIDFAPSRVVDDVVRLFSARASEKGLALSTHLPDGIPTAVRGDPTRLRQVLFNLVGNAIKFTEKGRIAIRLGCETADGGFTFRFEVQDTGIGLSAGQVATLFRPFTQADDSTTRRFGGTGLGLAICKRLVEAMRGTIDVTSTVGQGSSFWFTVTVAAGDPARVETETSTTAPQATGHPLRILLAEDNEVNRMVISAMLARMGHTVHGVGDGRQAVAAVAADDWDVVLMDMQMPEMDGSEATRLIRRMPPPKGEVPIVALSADALPEHRAHYMAGGLDGFLTKPVDWHDLAETVRRCQKGETPGVSPTHPAAPAQTADFPLLDPDRLNNLKESIGEEALLEMVEKLPPEFLKRLDALAAAVAAGDLHTAKRAAHQLRGLAGSFAATRVEAYARQIEEKAIDIAAVAAETGGLKEASRDTLAAFLALRAAGD